MSAKARSGGALARWYRRRIGEPTTNDEARGYWFFALGVILGIVGIAVFLRSRPAGTVRMISIVLASAGLTLLVAGPLIRLPLRRWANWLVYLGIVVCAVAIGWFVTIFPEGWNPSSGQADVITLYAVGLGIMAVGGVFVPILTPGPERDPAVEAAERERDVAREALTDTEADEADLAAQLSALRTSQARFELYEDKGGQWRWRLRHRNGNVIAASGEGYGSLANAQRGMQSVRRNALGAELLRIEDEAALPSEGEAFEALGAASAATFELYEDAGGEWRWRLRHDNGEIIADGGEGYASRQGARSAIDRVREYVGPAAYLRPDPTAFEIYLDRAGEWRWRLIHKNGNILADSSEGYATRNGARRAVDRLRERGADADIETYEDVAGEYRWRILGRNNQIIADSGEGYASEDGVEEAVDHVKSTLASAAVLDVGRAAFEVFEDAGGEFRWRLRSRNGNILADSAEGYSDRSSVYEAIESLKRNALEAETGTPESETPES